MKRFRARHAMIAGLVALGLSGSAFATDATSGLGQSWPNARDVSTSPRWHVYTFTKDGVEYVQINDLNGNVRAAFGTAGGQFLVLPMGRGAQTLVGGTTTTNSLLSSSLTEIVYKDDSVTVLASPTSDGSTQFTTVTSSSSGTGDCTDPIQCTVHVN